MTQRKELKRMNGVRTVFMAEFARYGTRRLSDNPTVLLKNVTTKSGRLVSDHLWFSLSVGFELLGKLRKGDRIQFVATVKRYKRGYKGTCKHIFAPIETDYKLSQPSNIVRIHDEI